MKIYADILIFENTIVDLFLLTITMQLIKHKVNLKKMILSALIGGIYTVVMFVPKLRIFTYLPFELLVAFFMIRISYGKTTVLNIAKIVVIFLLLTCMLSGVCFWISTKQNIYIIGKTFTIKKNSIKYIMIAVMIIYVICNRIINYIKERNFVSGFKYLLNFTVNDKEFKIYSFLDTGNELKEPVTNLPCILIEKNLVSDIDFNGKNSYAIPYNSIGYNGNLKGIRVNNIKISGKDNFKSEVDAIICPCNEKLSKENEFNALLSRGIV